MWSGGRETSPYSSAREVPDSLNSGARIIVCNIQGYSIQLNNVKL